MSATITVVCPHCNHRMRASSDYIGRKGRCPTCKALVEIVAAGDESLATLRTVPTPARRRTARGLIGSTDVPGWLTGLLGAAGTLAVYLLVVLPLRATYLGRLFESGHVVTALNTFITCWGIAILVLKYRAVRRQQSYAELELELIPLEIGLQITPANVDQFLEHLTALRAPQRLSILGRRIQGALEHFKGRNSVPEVQEYLASQAQVDASAVESGYTLLRAFIWCNPILGFIGTVLGISVAVAGLETTFGQQADLHEGLRGVTAGLATAFNTTLVGLAMTILLLFPTESLRKNEYRMLDRIETFTNESLLRRLSEERVSSATDALPEVVRDALAAAFREHQRWLAQWQAQVAQLGQVIGADFEAAIARIQEQISRAEVGRLERTDQTGRSLAEIFDRAGAATESWQRSEVVAGEQAATLLAAVEKLGRAVADFAALATQLEHDPSRKSGEPGDGDSFPPRKPARRGIFSRWRGLRS